MSANGIYVEKLGVVKIERIMADLDHYVWVRTVDGELCGPYDSVEEARADFMLAR